LGFAVLIPIEELGVLQTKKSWACTEDTLNEKNHDACKSAGFALASWDAAKGAPAKLAAALHCSLK
jgi:hypothetical protein